MDPQTLTTAEWAQVGTALKFLWAALGLAIIAGTSLLTAHALITSLVDSNTISSDWNKWRPILYGIGIAAAIGVLLCILLMVLSLEWLDTFYSRYWQ